jgi:MFS family permease
MQAPSHISRSRWRRDFGRFWLAEATSLTAEQVRELAVPLVAITVLEASAADLGLLGLAQWLPFLLLALPLGVLADRHRRRRLIMLSQWSRAALMVAVVAAALLGGLSLPLLLALVATLGVFAVLYEVCYQSVVPSLVPSAELQGANSRLQATASGAEVGGPGLGGLLAQALGAPIALLGTTLGYAVSGIAAASIRTPEPPPERPVTRAGFLPELREGIRHVVHDRYLLANVGFSALYNPFAQWIVVLFTLHCLRTLHLDAGQIGLVFSLGAAGALAAAALTPALTRRFRAGHLLLACAIVECGVLAVIPLVDADWGAPVIVAVLAGVWALNGAGTGVSSVLLVTIRQLRTPTRLLGRVNASMRTVTYGTISLGALAGGLAGEWLGTRWGLALGAGLCLMTVVWVALSPLARIRRIDDLSPAIPRTEAAQA